MNICNISLLKSLLKRIILQGEIFLLPPQALEPLNHGDRWPKIPQECPMFQNNFQIVFALANVKVCLVY